MTALAARTREEWLDARKSGIGGSDAAAVLGASPWKSPYALWAEKTGLETDLTDNEVLRWGRVLEGPIADEYAKISGRKLQYPGEFAIQRHPSLPHMICSLDRVIEPIDDRGPGSLSIKYVGPFKAGAWGEEAPIEYQVQLQHEMAVTGFKWAAFAVLIWGAGVKWMDVERNDNFIEALTDAERDFWKGVETGNPPPVDGSASTAEALKRLYPKDNGFAVEAPLEFAAKIEELREAKATIKSAKARVDAIENEAKALLGEASVLGLGGKPVCTYRTISRKAHEVKASEYRALKWKGAE